MAYGRTVTLRATISAMMSRHIRLLILCLLTACMVLTTTAHAQESYSFADMSCSGAQHADGDTDQVPADSDQPLPHHHGICHGHNLTMLPASTDPLPMAAARDARNGLEASPLSPLTVAPAIEPPRA